VGNPPAGCHFRYQNTRFLKANPRIVQPAGGSPTQLKHTQITLCDGCIAVFSYRVGDLRRTMRLCRRTRRLYSLFLTRRRYFLPGRGTCTVGDARRTLKVLWKYVETAFKSNLRTVRPYPKFELPRELPTGEETPEQRLLAATES